MTNASIAKEADVSVKTVENIMALNYDKDILRATSRRIEIAVIGSASKQHCYLNHDDSTLLEIIAQLQTEVDYWKKENDRKAKIIDKYLE